MDHASQSSRDGATLDEIIRRLRQVFQPSSVRPFGSRARGTNRPDADYDLLVVIPDSADPPYRRAQAAHAALWGLHASVDVLVLTEAEVVEQAAWTSSVVHAALAGGREVALHAG